MPDKKDLDYVGDNVDMLRNHLPVPLKQDRLDYDTYSEVLKSSNGYRTTYKPDYTRKYSAFEAINPEDQLGDKIVFENEYGTRPDDADIQNELPTYTDHFKNMINMTPERIELFSK
jgi:hypothetical protein